MVIRCSCQQQERLFVQAMAGVRMSADEICSVIGGGRGRASADVDGSPIAETTLYRHFKKEMAVAMLKTKLVVGWHQRSTMARRGRSSSS